MYYEFAILDTPLTFTYRSDTPLNQGDVAIVPVRGKKRRAAVLAQVPEPEYSCREVEEILPYRFLDHQLSIARFIATYYVCSYPEALGLFVPFSIELPRRKAPTIIEEVRLSPKQQEAFEFLASQKAALLFGDTGSGKSEIYIRYLQRIVGQGRRGILLMPEISLTPQMQRRLERYFGEGVVIWHSKLTKKRRQENLERIYSGEAWIVAGPRSALFLPLHDLGLIVVDEEHDDSYKSQSRPRYNARDVALYMGKELDIPVLLGSATPSPVTYHKLPSYRLKGSYHRSGGRRILYDQGTGLTDLVLQKLGAVFRAKKQALVFVPTRAHFKYLICQECGATIECPYCDVGMSVHFDRKALVCHYCNYAMPIPSSCPECGGASLEATRVGTKEVVGELERVFPDMKIAKFDRDAITTHTKLVKTLEDFRNRRIDVLVGTQMLSKGHDYPDVALSIILGLDYILAMADYRASERAMSLFVQVAGRTGRKEVGEVIVQTKNREFFEGFDDYEDFLRYELQQRKERYPPFVRLAQLLFAHKEDAVAKAAMKEALNRLASYDVQIVGSGRSAIERIAGKWRYHILLRSSSAKKLLQAIYGAKNELCEVDVDPVNLA